MNKVQAIPAAVSSPNPFVRKLLHFSSLDQDAASALETIQKSPQRVRAGYTIEPLEENASLMFVVQSGAVMNYTTLADGRRQILNFALPGDIVSRFPMKGQDIEWMSETITRSEISYLTLPTATATTALHPALGRALEDDLRRDSALLGNQILRIGRLTAFERVTHLIAEVHERYSVVGLVEDDTMPFPFTQSILADALGLSLVHVNRQISKLRGDGLISLKKKRMTLHDIEEIRKIASAAGDAESAAA